MKKNGLTLLFLFAVGGVACVQEDRLMNDVDPERSPIGKADLVGSCEGTQCDGPAPNGNCWCDEFCEQEGDCCADYEDVCIAEGTGDVVTVSAGQGFSCGLRPDDTLTCWGRNGVGQASPPTGTFSSVSAGMFHACGVRTDGTLVCWGLDDGDLYQITPPGRTLFICLGWRV